MLGSLDAVDDADGGGDKPSESRPQKKRGRSRTFSDDDDEVLPTRFRNLQVEGSAEARGSSSDQLSNKILEKFKTSLREMKVESLNLFKFALHPDSFDLTVRNIFHVFALASERKIRVRIRFVRFFCF